MEISLGKKKEGPQTLPGAPKPQKPTGGGLFSSHSSDKKKAPDPEFLMVKEESNVVARRIRVLEEQFTNLRRKTQVIDQNMISESKKSSTDIKMINSEINDIKRMLNDLETKMLLLIKELKLCAKKEDVNYLQKYVTMWEPIKFVTKKEVEMIVKDAVEEALSKDED